MKLPAAHLVLIAREKITDYLLNAAHPDNNGKQGTVLRVTWLCRGGVGVGGTIISEAGSVAEVTECLESAHGTKYVLDGAIETPCGKTPTIRTVWIVDRGRNCPRFVTAYPAEP